MRHSLARGPALVLVALSAVALATPASADAALAERVRAGASRQHGEESRSPRPPHADAWRCIHRYEGAWDDPDPPYYGGLQMDLGFQSAYAPGVLRRKGTADHWSPREQMCAAERALRAGRGFHPWPNAARLCGLL